MLKNIGLVEERIVRADREIGAPVHRLGARPFLGVETSLIPVAGIKTKEDTVITYWQRVQIGRSSLIGIFAARP
ncbi:MAG TPA: hypothetical protein VN873_18905 [Candidatus Angelobacter sp.]|nr:hypothetical protein [Candidatus Angelobacter sp.]